jgi:hypothetical protein
MKQPRISDFDPASRARELKSSMEELPAIERPEQIQPADQLPAPDHPARVDRVDRGVPAAQPKKRRIKPRHSLDLYEDQVETLQQLALEDRMRGGQGSMSAMAREALDEYIAKHSPGQ